MRILLVNDDGINALGIRALAEVFCLSHELIMVAPEDERSAYSHSLTVGKDISCVQLKESFEAYSISGTPADCVKLAVLQLLKGRKPDILISGINNGSNLGSDISYSGTVAAALEGASYQIPAIAVSLSSWDCDKSIYDEAAKFIYDNIDKLLSYELPVETVLNVNYPAHCKPKGVKVAPMGYNIYNDEYISTNNGYMIKGHPIEHKRNNGLSDVDLCKAGYITVTPIPLDRNDYRLVEKMKKARLF